MQPQNQMLYGGGSGGGGGGGGGGGLGRFRSAPAAWFDSLLEEEDVHVQLPPPPQLPPTPTQCLPQLPNLRNSGIYDPTTLFDTNFSRHNSSPPQLLATLSLPVGSEDYFSASGGGSSSYDILSCLDLPTSERPGDSDSTQQHQASQSVKGEQTFNDVEMEKLFQDSVPCRVRAKRGCATHPRSIAERVRRTRISDRIRKLQELVPNMDKQTNTADMLDEAVEYVKLLQKQIQSYLLESSIDAIRSRILVPLNPELGRNSLSIKSNANAKIGNRCKKIENSMDSLFGALEVQISWSSKQAGISSSYG